jgi:hypothetical protein
MENNSYQPDQFPDADSCKDIPRSRARYQELDEPSEPSVYIGETIVVANGRRAVEISGFSHDDFWYFNILLERAIYACARPDYDPTLKKEYVQDLIEASEILNTFELD